MKSKLRYECTSDYESRRGDILELRRELYGEDNSRFYDSFYRGNPLGAPLMGLCFDGTKLVGQENYILHNLAIDGKIYKGAMGLNTLVHPRYRLFHGVFGKLCEMTIEALQDKVDILYTYPTEETKKYYMKYFDWTVGSKIEVHKKITGVSGINLESILSAARPGRRQKDLELSAVDLYDDAIIGPMIESRLKKGAGSYLYKDTDYINWMFLKNSHYTVKGYYIKWQGGIKGYCLTYDSGTERKIVDFAVDNNDKKIYAKTLSALAHQSRIEGMKRIVIYSTPDGWHKSMLQRNAFIKRWEFDFIIYTFGRPVPESGWNVHIGDFDMF